MAKVELLKKETLVEVVKEALELKTKKSAEDFLADFDKVVDAVIDTLEVNEGIKLGSYIRVERVIQNEREMAEKTLNGVTIPAHTVPAKEVIRIKQTSKVKKAN